MSELTDKIRAKYPNQYDDLSDTDLESAILTKHPEYKDLAHDNTPVSNNALPINTNPNKSNWDKRPDGSEKGKGFLGVLNRPDGKVMSEFSIADSEQLKDAKGNYLDYPSLVPTLTRDEVNYLLKANPGDNIPQSIKDKAEKYALDRKAKGLPLFANDGEQFGLDEDNHKSNTPSHTEPSLIDKLKEGLKDAINSDKGQWLLNGHSPTSDKLMHDQGINETQGPELMKIPGTDKLANFIRDNGRNSGSYARGFTQSILGDLVDMIGSGFDPRASGIKDSPALADEQNIRFNRQTGESFTGDSPIKPDFITHAELPLNLTDEAGIDLGVPKSSEYTRPEGPWDTNFSNEPPPANPEERLLELAKEKQGMGLDKPTAKFVGMQSDADGGQVPLFNIEGGPSHGSTVTSDTLNKMGIEVPPIDTPEANATKGMNGDQIRQQMIDKMRAGLGDDKPLTPPVNISPKFGNVDRAEAPASKPRLLLNADGSYINKETGEMFDLRGRKIDPAEHKPGSLIDASSDTSNVPYDPTAGEFHEPEMVVNGRRINEPKDPEVKEGISFGDILNFPKALKASWDLSAPGRQGLPLIHNKEWWTAWGSMFEGAKSDQAFKAIQTEINNRPLFKSYNGEPSFAEKAGLKLTGIGQYGTREESFMSKLAEKVPGVKLSERAYVSYLNKLRADMFEKLMVNGKVLGQDGEYNMPLAQGIADYINNATGRGSLGALEKNAVELNNAFFSPRMIASRVKMLNPAYYWSADPFVRKEAIKSLFAVAGTGVALGQLAKLAGAEVSYDPTNSDFGKIKIGNTRIDPFAGFQQYVVAATRLLTGQSTSSVSGKTSDLTSNKFGARNRADVVGSFARSKESPSLSFAHSLLTGKDFAGKPVNVPEEVAQLFIPMVVNDLKSVATENPNLIPYLHDEGLGFENTDMSRAPLAIPGIFGAGITNYQSK